MAATVEFDFVGGAGTIGAGVSAESALKFNREDTLSGTTPVPIPTAANNTNYSFYKPCAFKVTGTGGSLTNFTIKYTTSPTTMPTGIYYYFKAVAQGSYVQAAVGNQVANGTTTNGETPATYTAMTTAAQQWDAAGGSAGTTGLKGQMVYLLLGVGNNYVGGGNSALAVPNIVATYDEA